MVTSPVTGLMVKGSVVVSKEYSTSPFEPTSGSLAKNCCVKILKHIVTQLIILLAMHDTSEQAQNNVISTWYRVTVVVLCVCLSVCYHANCYIRRLCVQTVMV